jgi:energy-coupling factor transport system substrate-specific component
VSWQAAALVLLLVALTGGFAWYEHRRPDARIVALVATLAALAALGRIAFAALPNVKPTTDIVLVAGFALGAGPGFAVGAIAGLTSNFFFGQGPWTPWQMAAWGAVGVLGAGLALLTRRKVNRWTLALVCAVIGFAFTAFQDVGDWVNYSDHSLASLGVYVGQGLGFDGVHAVGCLVFALAFAPALIHSISRFATRLEVTWLVAAPAEPPRDQRGWRPGGGTILPALIVLVLAGWLAVQAAGTGTATAAGTAEGYLLNAQNKDGGMGAAPGQASTQLFSGWAALGLAATGDNPQHVRRGGASLTAYLASGAGSLSDPGSLERTILAVRASGLQASDFGGRNLVAALEGRFKPDGSISEQTNLTSFGILALRSAGVSPPASALTWLVRQSDRDGGFNFGTAGGQSDVDDTGAALEALAGVPGRSAAVDRTRAVAYVERQQDHDGGFPSYPGQGSNSQSTAWAIQGLAAAGVDPNGLHRGGAPSPGDYLRSLTAADGHIRYSRGSDQTPVWVTSEAVMALAGKPLPIQAPSAPVTTPASHPSLTARTTTTTRHAAPRTAPGHRSPGRARPHAPPRHRVTPVPSAVGYLALADALVLAPVGLG